MNIKKKLAHYKSLKDRHQKWASTWDEVSKYFLPDSAIFHSEKNIGEQRTPLIFDNVGEISNTTLASVLHGTVTNPATNWFKLKISQQYAHLNDDKEVSAWLENVSKIMMAEILSPKTAHTSRCHEFYLSLCCLGTACMYIGQNSDKDALSFDNIHLSEICIDENIDGFVDTVYRTFKLTVRQIMQKWGAESLTDNMKKCLEKDNMDEKFTIIHCVHPRDGYNKKSERADEMPFASVYIAEEEQKLLHEGGFQEMPYAVARGLKVTGEIYGRSPAMSALNDVKTLQRYKRMHIKVGEKTADATILNPIGSVIDKKINAGAGKIINYDPSKGTPSLMPTGNINASDALINDTKQQIRSHFFIDDIQLHQSPAMTATEVLERTERMMRLMGPLHGRITSEFLGIKITRIFGLLYRMGKLPIPPQVLSGKDFDIEYVSPMARAQKQSELLGIMKTLEVIPMLSQIDPNVLKVVDSMEVLKHIANINGSPQSLFKSIEQVNQEIKMEQEQIRQQQTMANIQQGVEMAKNASQANKGMNNG